MDKGDRLVFHARPSEQGRPTLEVALSPSGTLEIATTPARDADYERDATATMRTRLGERADVLSTYLRQREWLRARLRGETPAPDPHARHPDAFGTSEASRDLWARALLRLALAPSSGTDASRLLRRAAELGAAPTRALAATAAIALGTVESALDLLRELPLLGTDDLWIAAVVASWRGDFPAADAALDRWLEDGTHARRVPIAAQLHAEAASLAAADRIARRALEALPSTDDTAIELLPFVEPAQPIGDLTKRVAAARQSNPGQVSSIAQTLIRRGEFHLARDLYARGLETWPESAALWRELAELLLWIGCFDEATLPIRRVASTDPAAAALLEAIRHLTGGSLPRAEEALRSVPRSARRDQRYTVLRSELLLRRGRHRRARRVLTEESGSHEIVAGRIIGAMCAIRCGEKERAVAGEDEEFGWIRTGELGALTPDEPPELPSGDDQLYGRLQRALENLRGNRSATPTIVAADGVPRNATPPPEMRQRSVEVLFRILHCDPERVHEDFSALIAACPGSAQPYCYRGELLLWLGRYDDAEEDFRRAHEISRLRRWAYVGLSAVALLRGRPQDTLSIAKQCEAICGPNSAATLGVYVGEAHRVLGHRRRAIWALDAALAAKPTRLGARINRALAETGRHAERMLADAWQRVCASAPGLAAAVAVDVSPERDDHAAKLRACLSRMRGNRSSSIVTYVDTDGRLRARRISAGEMMRCTNDLHREYILDFFDV